MASKTMETKDLQKGKYNREMDQRQALLREKGLEAKDIQRDSKMKHYKAKLKQLEGAVARINAIEDRTKKNIEKREQKIAEEATRKAEEMAGATKKSKKKEEAPPPAPTKKKGGGAQKAKTGGGEQKKKK
jgi:hypothetical protein